MATKSNPILFTALAFPQKMNGTMKPQVVIETFAASLPGICPTLKIVREEVAV